MGTEHAINTFGRDTRKCGDPQLWFPMRVTYSREMKVKNELDRLGLKNFLPMKYKVMDADTDHPHRELVPAINNLIFVHSSQEQISHLKATNGVLELMRFMVDHTIQEEHTIMTVPEDENCVVGKEGKRVLITGGDFEGVTGTIRRVKHCKRVVVELEGITAVAIAFVPAALLKEIKE